MTISLPSRVQIAYAPPDLPNLLSLASYLYLLSFTSSLADSTINAPLLGPLLVGVLLGPSLGGLLTPATQQTFIDLGYIALILVVFDAGLTTHLPLLIGNAGVSSAAALTGILLPIALSMALFNGAWGYRGLQAFAAGAALCSTSLGTTLALLTPKLRKTRVGSVLLCAALLDDVVGLVVAGIIPQLAEADSGVDLATIVRPILVSIAFGLGTPLLAFSLRKLLSWDRFQMPSQKIKDGLHTETTKTRSSNNYPKLLYDTRTQLFIIVLTIFAFVAGTKYAGTSELFGAFLAGAFLAFIFSNSDNSKFTVSKVSSLNPTSTDSPSPSLSASPNDCDNATPSESNPEPSNPLEAFTTHILPILTPFLGPIFFASIGAAIPVKALFTTYPNSTANGNRTNVAVDRGPASHRVVWRGIVYSLLMVLAKMAVGLWMLVWPERGLRPSAAVRALGRTFRRWFKIMKMNVIMWDQARRYSPSAGDEGVCEQGLVPASKDGLKDPSSGEGLLGARLGQLESGAGTSLSALPEPSSSPILDPTPAKLTSKPHPQEQKRQLTNTDAHNLGEPTRTRAAALLGIAMVARGEIALIVAQLARPLLLEPSSDNDTNAVGTPDEEPFAIVIWAILISTVGGALGVGILLGAWRRSDERSARQQERELAKEVTKECGYGQMGGVIRSKETQIKVEKEGNLEAPAVL